MLLVAFSLSFLFSFTTFSQCLTAPYGQWPGTTFTPACGATCTYQTITTVGYAGEYSRVNVVAGNTYRFRSSFATDYITISNTTGTVTYAFGIGGAPGITWVATITGVVRFYTHANGPAACATNTTSRTRSVCCIGGGPTAPANDLVCNATTITCGSTTAGTTVNATSTGTYEGTTLCGTAQSSAGVWYRFVGTGQTITASLCATAWDSKIQVYSGATCTALTCVGGIDDNGPACAGLSASYSWPSVLGTTYWINVSGYSTTSAFSLSLTCAAAIVAPPNDLVCNATAISCGATLAGTTINATNSGTGEALTCGTNQSMPGVWYVVPGNGQIMTASLCGTVWDSKISVFSGTSCAALTCVGGVDDNGPACATTSASFSWTSVVGQNYYILVHGFSLNSAFNIALTCTSPPPPDVTSITASASTICNGQSTTLTANGASGTVYWFTGSCATTGQIGTGNSITVSPTTTTTYYARNFNGVQWSTNCATTTITVNPNPTVNAGADQTLCPGNVNLSGTVAPMSADAFSENFGGVVNWLTNDPTRWLVNTSANAGGVSPELMFQWSSGGVGTIIDASAFSPAINGTGFTGLTMSFNHNVSHFTGSYVLSAEVSLDNVTWNPLWSITPTANVATTTVSGLNLSAYDNQLFYIRFRFSGDVWNINNWYIDNIVISGNTVPPFSWSSTPAGFTSSILNPSFNVTTTTTFTLSATQNGCTSTDNVLITIQDLIAPTITAPANVSVNADAGSCAATGVALGTPTTADNCSVASVTNDAPASFPVGTTVVTWTVTDGSGNTAAATQNVVITDNENPTITAPTTVNVNTDAGLCTASGVALGSAVTADNCAVASATNDAPSIYPEGSTTVTWTVTDDSGNTTTATQTVNVTDIQNPTITAPSAVTVNADAGLCTASGVTLGSAITADNCTVASVVNDGPATYPLGATTVTWTVTDGSGNTATAIQTVTVLDNQNPTITAPAVVTVNADAGSCAAIGVALGSPTTADNCSVASVTNDAPASFPVGTTVVTWTVTDGSGNTATATQNVVVTDNQNPTITAPVTVNVNTDAGICTASGVALGSAVTADNCSVASVVNDAPAIFPLGSTTVTWTVTDASGNTTTATQTVNVTDIQNPTITAPSAVTVNADAGLCTASGVTLSSTITADNCAVASVVNDGPATYPLGATTVTWTVTDGSGNTATDTQTITVLDNQNPTITAPADVNVNADAGSCAATGVALGTSTTADNCSVASVTNDAPASFPVGTTVVTWTVTDGSGNTATAAQNVVVTDNQNPTITAPSNVSVTTDPGLCSASSVSLGSPITADNCSVASVVNDAPAIFPEGLTTVTWTVTDAAGNSATSTQTVTVTDNENPSPLCQNITVQLDATGNISITPAQIDNGSTDNCGIATLALSQTSFTCAQVGANPVVLTVTDIHSNVSTCAAIVNVEDIIAPTALCQNVTVQLDPSGVAIVTPAQIDNGSFDNCGIASLALSQTSFGCFNVGVNNVTLTVTDVNGNVSTCGAIVTVNDNVAPGFATVPSDITESAVNGLCGRVVTYPIPSYFDACGAVITQTDGSGLTSGDIFPVGVTTQTYSLTDASGNSIDTSFTITITDDELPVITNCPANITISASSTSCGAIVNWVEPVISDNCPAVSVVASHAPGSTFNVGNTAVTYTATDASGNTSTCTFNITVTDNTAPLVPSLAAITGSCSATVTAPITTDNCAGSVTGITSDPLVYNTQGTYSITWAFNDGNGNISTAVQTVVVSDLIAPSIAAPSNVNTNTNAACASTGVLLGTPTTSDNCSVASVNNNAPATFPIGTTIVTWTVTDAAGNVSTATQTVTVTDNTNPTISAPASVTVVANGSCTAFNVGLGTPITTDNCTVASVTNNAPAVYPLGNTTVIWTVTDASGNTATATQIVTVIDQGNPTLIAPANIVIPAGTNCIVSVSGIGSAFASDNCTIGAVTNNAPATFPIGVTNVIWSVTDGAGNTATATQVVTVVDLIAPSITPPAAVIANTNSGCTATGIALGTPVSSDNCSAVTLSNNAPSTYPIGVTVVTWTATDASGNASTATQTVTVNDVTPPVVTAPANITVSSITGCNAQNVNIGAPVYSDNCSVVSVTNNAPASFPSGNTTVTWTVTDASGNSTTASQTVTVSDQTAPTIVAPSNITTVTDLGCAATGIPLGSPITSDNCSAVTVTNNAPSSFPIGTTVITWTATDASGNATSALQSVTVNDAIAPTVTAPANVTVLPNNGCSAINVNIGTPQFSDNCSVISVTNNAPSTFPAGGTTVTWTVTDASGNSTTTQQTVTVIDQIAPTIVAPSAVTATTSAGCTATGVVLGTPVAIDNCSAVTVTNNAPTTYPIGTTVVTWTATDAAGNTSTAAQTVTVSDQTNPTILAPNAITTSTNNGCSAINVNLGTPVTNDNCAVASVTNNAPAVYPLGLTVITWIVTDASGNTSTTTQNVTVNDTELPIIIAPSSLNVNITGNCVASNVVLGNPFASDNCSIATVVNNAPIEFPVGTTTITWTATDASGNVSTATQTVTVTDAINPVALLQDITITLNSSGLASITFADIDLGSSDNCGIASNALSQSDFDCGDVGLNTVTVSLIDVNGNTTIATVSVTVQTNGIDSDNDGIDDSCDDDADPILADIPEAFTPNGNNINDVFEINNLFSFNERKLEVFNRYGLSVYKNDLYDNTWNGTRSDNGQELPDGTYYYILVLDGEINKGFVYINRVKQ
jgi:gliding motility-associated-like protein